MVWGSIAMPCGSLLRHPESEANFQRTTGSSQFASISLPIADMEAVGATLCGTDFMPPREPLSVTPPPGAMERLQNFMRRPGIWRITPPR